MLPDMLACSAQSHRSTHRGLPAVHEAHEGGHGGGRAEEGRLVGLVASRQYPEAIHSLAYQDWVHLNGHKHTIVILDKVRACSARHALRYMWLSTYHCRLAAFNANSQCSKGQAALQAVKKVLKQSAWRYLNAAAYIMPA